MLTDFLQSNLSVSTIFLLLNLAAIGFAVKVVWSVRQKVYRQTVLPSVIKDIQPILMPMIVFILALLMLLLFSHIKIEQSTIQSSETMKLLSLAFAAVAMLAGTIWFYVKLKGVKTSGYLATYLFSEPSSTQLALVLARIQPFALSSEQSSFEKIALQAYKDYKIDHKQSIALQGISLEAFLTRAKASLDHVRQDLKQLPLLSKYSFGELSHLVNSVDERVGAHTKDVHRIFVWLNPFRLLTGRVEKYFKLNIFTISGVLEREVSYWLHAKLYHYTYQLLVDMNPSAVTAMPTALTDVDGHAHHLWHRIINYLLFPVMIQVVIAIIFLIITFSGVDVWLLLSMLSLMVMFYAANIIVNVQNWKSLIVDLTQVSANKSHRAELPTPMIENHLRKKQQDLYAQAFKAHPQTNQLGGYASQLMAQTWSSSITFVRHHSVQKHDFYVQDMIESIHAWIEDTEQRLDDCYQAKVIQKYEKLVKPLPELIEFEQLDDSPSAWERADDDLRSWIKAKGIDKTVQVMQVHNLLAEIIVWHGGYRLIQLLTGNTERSAKTLTPSHNQQCTLMDAPTQSTNEEKAMSSIELASILNNDMIKSIINMFGGDNEVEKPILTKAAELKNELDKLDAVTVKVALFGQPGAGKSSLINKLVGKTVVASGIETDKTVDKECHKANGLLFCDLPGYGTSKFPKEGYFEKFELEQIDLFLCVLSGKLNQSDTAFFQELTQRGKVCVFVVNKFDDLWEVDEHGIEIPKDVLVKRKMEDIIKHVGTTSIEIVFTSCRTGYGLDALNRAITHHLDSAKKERWERSAQAYSEEFLTKKYADMESYISKKSWVAAANGINPVPGLDIAVDVGIIVNMFSNIREGYGLTDEKLEALSKNGTATVVGLANKTVQYAMTDGVMVLLKRYGTVYATKEVAKYIPLAGQALAATAAYFITSYAGKGYLDDCHQLATEILKEQLSRTSAKT